MWLRREWLFWSRLVRYHVLNVSAVRALDANGFKLRLIGQVALAALFLLAGGYVVGRVTAPACAPLASAVCKEAQSLSPPASIPMEVERQVVIVTADVRPAAPAPPSPPIDPVAATMPSGSAEAIQPLAENKRAERIVTLTNDEVREMQAWLKVFGFDPGPIDGYPGARTKAAVKRYQAARQTEETGELDRSLLRKVRREAGHS